jgi:uncharacterized protein (TIGR00288 family)
MQTVDRVGIFVDVENLTQWVKQDGLEQLIEELTSMGAIIVRRAYAKWTLPSLTPHQNILNRLGFELIHTFHPISGKNSADIQIVVDVMEYAWRDPDLRWIALATGDSDFSPLFRRLREMGRQVVGAGPKSALSESVKSSCSRFIYLDREDSIEKTDEAVRASAFDDAADLLEKALKTFDEPANCSALKTRMLNIDSAFDERQLGFKGFNDFVSQVDTVELTLNGKSWFVSFTHNTVNDGASPEGKTGLSHDSDAQNLVDHYRTILRKKGWRSMPLPIVEECYRQLAPVEPMARSEMAVSVVSSASSTRLTAADVKKVMTLFFKAGMMIKKANPHGLNGEEAFWKVEALPEEKVPYVIDRAMLCRLLSGLEEFSVPFKQVAVAPLLLQSRQAGELNQLIKEARQQLRDSDKS